MGKDCSSWLYQQHSPRQSPNLNSMGIPSNPGQQSSGNPTLFSPHTNPYIFLAPSSGTEPGFAVSEFTDLNSVGGNGHQSWYYGYPNLTFTSMTTNSIFGGRFSAHPPELCKPAPNTDEKKRDVVYDWSKNQMSSVFSSQGYPFQDPYYTDLKSFAANGFHGEPSIRGPFIPNSVNSADWCAVDKSHEIGIKCGDKSEMHEDTEELDALLCSDDDEDEDETSTGHSPSEMAGCNIQGAVDDNAEVASSVTPKRRRLENDPSLIDTASSGKAWSCKDDAELSCVKGTIPSSVSKRLRKKRIRETVGILRSIIPGGKGKDTAAVLDEAIRYLKSCGLKAKAIGISAL